MPQNIEIKRQCPYCGTITEYSTMFAKTGLFGVLNNVSPSSHGWMTNLICGNCQTAITFPEILGMQNEYLERLIENTIKRELSRLGRLEKVTPNNNLGNPETDTMELRRQMNRIENTLKSYDAQINQLQKDMAVYRGQISQLQNAQMNNSAQINLFQNSQMTNTSQIAQLQNAHMACESQISRLYNELEKSKIDFINLQKNSAQVKNSQQGSPTSFNTGMITKHIIPNMQNDQGYSPNKVSGDLTDLSRQSSASAAKNINSDFNIETYNKYVNSTKLFPKSFEPISFEVEGNGPSMKIMKTNGRPLYYICSTKEKSVFEVYPSRMVFDDEQGYRYIEKLFDISGGSGPRVKLTLPCKIFSTNMENNYELASKGKVEF